MKKLHTLFILDRSGSMQPYTKRTIESLNADIKALQLEVEKGKGSVKVYNTLMTFASTGFYSQRGEMDFLFPQLNVDIMNCPEITDKDYQPNGGTPLLDAIGIGIDKLKETIGDELGSDDTHVIVTIFTDGEENSSTQYNHEAIKKMISHFSENPRWKFSFIGCGSFENVSAVSSNIGIAQADTTAFVASDAGYKTAYDSYTTTRCCYVASLSNETSS